MGHKSPNINKRSREIKKIATSVRSSADADIKEKYCKKRMSRREYYRLWQIVDTLGCGAREELLKFADLSPFYIQTSCSFDKG